MYSENGQSLSMTSESAQSLTRRIDTILELMEMEHRHAETHSQRNHYQAVIRHELEIMQSAIRYSGAAMPVALQTEDVPF